MQKAELELEEIEKEIAKWIFLNRLWKAKHWNFFTRCDPMVVPDQVGLSDNIKKEMRNLITKWRTTQEFHNIVMVKRGIRKQIVLKTA